MVDWLFDWWEGRQLRRRCFHHDRQTGESYVEGFLVDLGRAKHFRCHLCGKYWT